MGDGRNETGDFSTTRGTGMRIVIDIPEGYRELYEAEKCKSKFNSLATNEFGYVLRKAFENSTPLHKGHGDLVTKEQMIELVEFYQLLPQHFSFVNLVDDIKDEKPIIEADKEE